MRAVIDAFALGYARYRRLGEGALAQVEDHQLHRLAGGDGGISLATLIQHVGGNLHSRFAEFLAGDGEQPWRHRDGEFTDARRHRGELMAVWDTGWRTLEATLQALDDQDLGRTVLVRSQPLSVCDALVRSLAHTAYHVGEMVVLSRAQVGDAWRSLSIPKGASVAYNANPTRERG